MAGYDPIFPTTKGILRKLGGDKETLSIKWDGNTEGRASFELMEGYTLVHVSDKVLTVDDINGTTLTSKDPETGKESSNAISDAMEMQPGVVSADSANVVSFAQAGDFEGVYIPKAGTYFLTFSVNGVGYHVCSLSKETIVPIDQKYLPPVDSITMNGADGKQYKLTVNNGAISVAEVV